LYLRFLLKFKNYWIWGLRVWETRTSWGLRKWRKSIFTEQRCWAVKDTEILKTLE
jgi:hypothetical protein